MKKQRVISGALALSAVLATHVRAQAPNPSPQPGHATGPGTSQDLAKQLANPVASLISVPFQPNWETGVGPEEDTRFVLNFQP